MRIVFLLATRNFGGAQRSSLEMANRLCQKHEVLVVEVEGTDESYTKAIAEFGLSIKKYSGSTKLKGPLRKLASWYQWTHWLKGVFKEWQPDVVIVKDTKTLSLLSPKAGYKIFFHARAWYASYQISRFKKATFNRIKPNFMAVSQATRHALFNSGLAPLQNISVVPNALNLPAQFSKKPNEKEHLRLLHAGGFIASKGQHITLEVARSLKEQGIPFHLKMPGFIYNTSVSKNYHKQLLTTIQQYDLVNEVSIITNHSNLDDLYLESDILLHPSETEGLPRVIMEAMHYELVVIANPVGGVIDLINDGLTGYIVDYNRVEMFVERIIHLYEHPQIRTGMANEASTLIKNGYTMERQLRNLESAFSRIK